MRSVKAILAGIVFIVIASLVLQLAYLFLAIALNSFSQSYPVLQGLRGVLVYVITIPLLILIMFIGGYITAYIARAKVVLHSFIVACVTVVGMLWYAMSYMQLTVSGVIVLLLALAASVTGALHAQKAAAVSTVVESS